MKLPAVVTEGFLQSLPAAERKKLGRAGVTAAEARASYQRGQEKALQREVWNYLNLKGIYFEFDSMHKRTSGKKGRGDFRCCVDGLWLTIECKAESQTLSKEQAAEAARLRESGGRFVIVFNLNDAIEAVNDMHAL